MPLNIPRIQDRVYPQGRPVTMYERRGCLRVERNRGLVIYSRTAEALFARVTAVIGLGAGPHPSAVKPGDRVRVVAPRHPKGLALSTLCFRYTSRLPVRSQRFSYPGECSCARTIMDWPSPLRWDGTPGTISLATSLRIPSFLPHKH